MVTQAKAPTPRARDWRPAFTDLPREHGFEPLAVEGALPAALRGTMYRNGPSLFGSQGRPYDHWFDGDGAVSAVRFEEGSASGAVRLVQSRGLAAERRAGKMLYGGYGTPAPGLLRRLRGAFKNAANTSVLLWSGRLFALLEAGKPTELDPETLATLGETDLDGAVVRSFSAHPHRVPARRAGYNFGVRYGRRTLLDLYELPDRGPARLMATLPLAGPTMIHDFIVTENHLVFFAPPLRLQIGRLLLGRGGYADNLAWRPELGTEVLVVPIDAPDRPRRFEVEPFYQWHYANAFERGDEIVVDFVRYPDFRNNAAIGAIPRGGGVGTVDGTLHRAVLDPARGRFRSEAIWSGNSEFPRIAGRLAGAEHRYCYVAAHDGATESGLGGLARIDAATGAVTRFSFEPGQFATEPVFVRRPGGSAEDDGWVLVQVYDPASHTSHEAVFDARALDAGPIARASFDHHVPPRFHGMFRRA